MNCGKSLRFPVKKQRNVSGVLALAYADNYIGDLSFYQNVKQAAKRGVPGTAALYDDLQLRFPGRPREEEATPAALLNS